MAYLMCRIEGVDSTQYNFTNIRCYEALGAELNGTNVIYYTFDGGSCFVSNNKYEVFEVPSNKNSSEIDLEGNFLLLSHNIDFDYWGISELEYYIDRKETSKLSLLIDSAEISPFGYYQVTNERW